jgi:hypothetical protein
MHRARDALNLCERERSTCISRPGLGTVPIIFNGAKRRALPPVHEQPFGMKYAPLETQHVFQRMLLEVFARVLLRHACEQVFQLLGLGWLREWSPPNNGEDLSGSVVMPRAASRTKDRLNTTRRALTMKQCSGGLEGT